jgi:hypothetical protein
MGFHHPRRHGLEQQERAQAVVRENTGNDFPDGEVIVGWAWDLKKPDTAVKVDIYDGDTKLATVTADQFRQDLADAKIGNGKHGLSYPTPARLKDGKAHTIRVKVAGKKKGRSSFPGRRKRCPEPTTRRDPKRFQAAWFPLLFPSQHLPA